MMYLNYNLFRCKLGLIELFDLESHWRMAFQEGCLVDRVHGLSEQYIPQLQVLTKTCTGHICIKKKYVRTYIICNYLNLGYKFYMPA